MTEFMVFNKLKGGSGATTTAFNCAKYLQKKGKRVLLIDEDFSTISLTSRFILREEQQNKIKPENEVNGLFDINGNPAPIHVDKSIWLIAGNRNLQELEDKVQKGMGRRYIFFWAKKHLDELQELYDFILIDTHNDASMITKNALLVADKVIVIADVDQDAMDAIPDVMQNINELKELEINTNTMESLVNAQVFVIGNKVKHIGASHIKFKKDFEELMKAHPNYFVGYFPDREMIHRTKTDNKSVFDLEKKVEYQDASHRKVVSQMENIYQKICGV